MRRVPVLLLPVLLTLPPGLAWGTTFIAKDFDKLVAEAEEIFVGTVIATESRKLPSGAIVTDVTFSSLRVLKGGEGTGETILRVLGGTVGSETLKLAGVPRFELGVTYLVFSKGNGKVIFPVVGGDQGLFQIKRDPTTGDELVFDSYGMVITRPSVREATGGSGFQKDRNMPPVPVLLDAFIQAIKNRIGR